jgi:hypothetical protein
MVEIALDFASIQHFVDSLAHLWSFDHAQCDAILAERGIEITNAFRPLKSVDERNTVYSGFSFMVIWTAIVGSACLISWLPANRHTRVSKIRLPTTLCVLLAPFLLWSQLEAAVNYVDVCRSLLPQH